MLSLTQTSRPPPLGCSNVLASPGVVPTSQRLSWLAARRPCHMMGYEAEWRGMRTVIHRSMRAIGKGRLRRR